MADGKGFARQQFGTASAPGTFHEPDLRRIKDASFLDTPSVEPGHRLELGRPLLCDGNGLTQFDTWEYTGFPDKTIESSRSAHIVGFGRVAIKGAAGSREIDVAVKPFHKPNGAIREARGYMRLASMGLRSYMPLGIFPAKHGSHFIALTIKRNDLESLDRDSWVIGSQPTDEASIRTLEKNEDVVSGIAAEMATLHAHGFFHPDGQIKNWAINPAGKIRAIDTENYIEVPVGHSESPALAWEDINKLVKSLVVDGSDEESKVYGVGMFARMPLDRVRENISRLLIAPYQARLCELSEQPGLTDAQSFHLQTLFDEIEANFGATPNWPINYVTWNK